MSAKMEKHQLDSERDLENAIHKTIIDVMDAAGDGTPEIVAEVAEEVCDNYPELRIYYGMSKIYEVVKRSFHSELPMVSEAYTTLFGEFNKQYFAGQLPGYLVKVFYGVGVDSASSSQVIRLRVTAPERWMIADLLSIMAEVAVGCHGGQLHSEMERLRLMGAPIRKETERGNWECPSQTECAEALRLVGQMLIGANRLLKQIPII